MPASQIRFQPFPEERIAEPVFSAMAIIYEAQCDKTVKRTLDGSGACNANMIHEIRREHPCLTISASPLRTVNWFGVRSSMMDSKPFFSRANTTANAFGKSPAVTIPPSSVTPHSASHNSCTSPETPSANSITDLAVSYARLRYAICVILLQPCKYTFQRDGTNYTKTILPLGIKSLDCSHPVIPHPPHHQNQILPTQLRTTHGRYMVLFTDMHTDS